MKAKEKELFARIDSEIVRLSKNIQILSQLSWSKEIQDDFLYNVKSDIWKLPKVEYPKQDYRLLIQNFDTLAHSVEEEHPVGRYLKQTAQSYTTALRMLQAIGTKELSSYSKILYGSPRDHLSGSNLSVVEAAKYFVSLVNEIKTDCHSDMNAEVYEPSELAQLLKTSIDALFTNDKIDVFVDPNLTAKAAAGPERIRVRGGIRFTRYDFRQLLEHEAFIHSLTAINGKHQPLLKSLAITSPRATATQEGLATFAELITNSIDLLRLKRIALRIVAIDKALEGADFIEVFKYFREEGQTDAESYQSAMRVFRGCSPKGGVAFTKDTSYLGGLISVHTFFRSMLKENRLPVAEVLFSGKMSVTDAGELAPFVHEGLVAPPRYLPHWFRDFQSLAANLAFSVFANKIHI